VASEIGFGRMVCRGTTHTGITLQNRSSARRSRKPPSDSGPHTILHLKDRGPSGNWICLICRQIKVTEGSLPFSSMNSTLAPWIKHSRCTSGSNGTAELLTRKHIGTYIVACLIRVAIAGFASRHGRLPRTFPQVAMRRLAMAMWFYRKRGECLDRSRVSSLF
jgi:hypothetical protein